MALLICWALHWFGCTDLLSTRMKINPNPKFMGEITTYIDVETPCSLGKHSMIVQIQNI